MGKQNAAMACSRTTKGVIHIHWKQGYHACGYLDDLVGVASPDVGVEALRSQGEFVKSVPSIYTTNCAGGVH